MLDNLISNTESLKYTFKTLHNEIHQQVGWGISAVIDSILNCNLLLYKMVHRIKALPAAQTIKMFRFVRDIKAEMKYTLHLKKRH